MMSLHSDACQKLLPPLIDGLINDGLTEVWPHLNQTLFQLINAFLNTPGPKDSPNSVVNRVQVRAVRWPEVGRDAFWAALQIQYRSPKSRPVASLNQSQTQLTRPVATGLGLQRDPGTPGVTWRRYSTVGTCTMGWCAVLLENKQVAGNRTD